MRKCDIDLKTLRNAIEDTAAFASRGDRQEQVNEAFECAKEAKRPCEIKYEKDDYSISEHVRPGLTITVLRLSFDLEPEAFEVLVDDRGDTYDLLHHHHTIWGKHAVENGLIENGNPPPGGVKVAEFRDGRWHNYQGTTKDAVEFHESHPTPMIYLGSYIEDAMAQAAWLLMQDKKAAGDVTHWFVEYCRKTAAWKAGAAGYFDEEEFLSTLFDGQYKYHIAADSLKNFLRKQFHIGHRKKGAGWSEDWYDTDRYKTAESKSGKMRSAYPHMESGRGPANPEDYFLKKDLEISARTLSELLCIPESTIRDAIKAGKIHPRTDSTEARNDYVLHKRNRYYFNKEQAEEARIYFSKHREDKALRWKIVEEYAKKRCVTDDYKKCYDAARQWLYRELKREPKPTLDELLERVKKMKKPSKGEHHGE